MKRSGFNKQTGASVVEMLIVVAVIGVLVTIAVAQFGGSASNLDRQNIAREFKVNLERARFDSVKRRASVCADMARVEIANDTSFRIYTDMNQNGTIDATSEFKTIDFGNRSNVKIIGSTLPVTIRFDQRGNVTTGTCASPATTIPTTTFCNTPCTISTATAANANMIFVSPTGTAAMMPGGSTMPTFSPPAVSNVNSNANVNPLVAVWDAVPIASVTPTPVPTATPVPSPTATPPTNPTGTPTPTPVACLYGQRPATIGCVCTSPMRVRTSGKCQ